MRTGLEHARGLIDRIDISHGSQSVPDSWCNSFRSSQASVLLPYAAACFSLTDIDADFTGMCPELESDSGLRSDRALEEILKSRGGYLAAR